MKPLLAPLYWSPRAVTQADGLGTRVVVLVVDGFSVWVKPFCISFNNCFIPWSKRLVVHTHAPGIWSTPSFGSGIMTKSMVKPQMLVWWTLDTILMSHVKLLGVSSFQTPDHQWATVPGVRPTGPQHQLDRIPWRPFGPLEADVSFVIPTIRLFYSDFPFRGYFIARQLFYCTPMVLMWLPQANNKPTVCRWWLPSIF